MNQRTIAVLVLVALLLIGGWMLARPDGETPSLDTDDTTSSTGSPATLTGSAEVARDVPATAPDTAPPVVADPPTPSPERAETVSIRVRVVDENDVAVEGVEIRERFTSSTGGLKKRTLGRSNSEGWADLWVPAGKVVLLVGDSGKWHCSEVLVVNGNTEGLVFHMVEMVTLQGTVLTFTGKPSAGTRVWGSYPVRGRPTRTHAGFGPTDADGHFTIRIPPNVAELRLTAFAKDGGKADITIDPSEETEVILQFRRFVRIQGVVAGSGGEPVGDYSAWVLPLEDGQIQRVSNGSDGKFWISVSATGRYLLLVTPGPTTGLAAPDPLEVTAPVEGLRLVCAKGTTLTGTVVGEDVEGFQILWTRHRGESLSTRIRQVVKTSKAGGFTLRGLSTGDTVLYVFREGDDRYGLIKNVRLSDKSLKIVLQRAQVLKGRVVGHTGRHGLDLQVGLTWRGPTRWATVQDDGTFSVAGLPPGTYGVRWTRGDYRKKTEQKIETGGAAIDIVLPASALSVGLVPPK